MTVGDLVDLFQRLDALEDEIHQLPDEVTEQREELSESIEIGIRKLRALEV